jgi:Uncharacterised nucleotidyltransferase
VAGRATLVDPVIEPTARLLWEACRPEPDRDCVRRVLDGGADVTLAVSAAEEHRISALLWRALDTADVLDMLNADRTSLKGTADAFAMEALLLIPRAVDLAVSPLTAAGLEPVVFKGPALAARYPRPGLRPMEDIDLLLPRGDHTRALSALAAAGWSVVRAARDEQYDTVLTHPEVPSLFLELHFGLETASQRVTTLDPVTLWSRRQRAVVAGTPAFVLPQDEELVVLAAHAGKPHHGFVRLVWIADIAMIVRAAEDDGNPVDWHRVRAVAGSTRCVTVVGAALAMARHAGVDAPTDLFPLPSRGWRGAAMRQLLSVSWPLTHLELPGYQLNYALADDPMQRLKILLVLRGSGYGIGGRVRRMLALPRRALSGARSFD